MMQEELGDVLMQVVFHTVIEEERGRFDMEKGLPRGVREAGLPPPEHLCFLCGGKMLV